MAGNLSSDGSIIWFTPVTTLSTVDVGVTTTSGNNSFLSGLYACDIKTSLLGKSIKIEKAGVPIGFVELKEITSFDLLGDTIVLYTTDKIPFNLIFLNTQEALGGYNKIEIAVSGGYVDCSGDPILTKTLTLFDVSSNTTLSPSAILYPCLLIVNNIPVKKVSSQSDAVNYFNSVSGGNFICVAGGNAVSFIFSYRKYQEAYIPTTLSVVSNYFTVITSNQILNFIYDTLPGTFWCVGSTGGIGTTDSFDFLTAGTNILDIFYSTTYAASIDLSNANISSISGNLPIGLSSFTLINSTVTSFSFLTPLVNLAQLDLEGNVNALTLPSFATGKNLLQNITLKNLAISDISSFSNLPALATLYVENLPIKTTPLLAVSNNLVFLSFIRCYFLTTVSPVTLNKQLQYFIIDMAPVLTTIAITFTTNTLMTNLQVTNTGVTALPSLVNNKRLIKVLLNNNNFTVIAIQNFVHDISVDIIGQSGILLFTNQLGAYDPSAFNNTFLNDVDFLQTTMKWSVKY